MDICLLHIIPAWDGRICLLRSATGRFVFFRFCFRVRESQRLQWCHLPKSLGQAAKFEVPPTTTTPQQLDFVFYAARTCTWELCSEGGDLLKVQLVIVLVLGSWKAGTLTCVIHLYLLVFYSQRTFVQIASSSKTMASQKLGNQCPFIAGLRLYGIQVSMPDLSGL